MPVDQKFMDESKYLSPDEYVEIIGQLVSLGLEEVRLTGGEPLMRKSFSEIALKLAKLPLKKMALTTNGIYLDKYFDVLKEARIFHLNISLDSLDEVNFQKITFANHLDRVVSNIKKAKALGFIVKVNMVVMKGINDHDVMDFVKFAEDTGVEVRFLELMHLVSNMIGLFPPMHSLRESNFITNSNQSRRLLTRHPLILLPRKGPRLALLLLSLNRFVASVRAGVCLLMGFYVRVCLKTMDGRLKI
jgi:molybdenum cofactor biosynthesis enzyme MoaA